MKKEELDNISDIDKWTDDILRYTNSPFGDRKFIKQSLQLAWLAGKDFGEKIMLKMAQNNYKEIKSLIPHIPDSS